MHALKVIKCNCANRRLHAFRLRCLSSSDVRRGIFCFRKNLLSRSTGRPSSSSSAWNNSRFIFASGVRVEMHHALGCLLLCHCRTMLASRGCTAFESWASVEYYTEATSLLGDARNAVINRLERGFDANESVGQSSLQKVHYNWLTCRACTERF